MATHLSHRRLLLRDVPRLAVLSFWALVGFAILVYCFERPAVQRMISAALHQGTMARPTADPGNTQTMYTGSILFVPPRGELCGQWIFDNRNGEMWDNGQVNCRPPDASNRSGEATSTARMIAIGKAFKGE
jgi:hypothetical protein